MQFKTIVKNLKNEERRMMWPQGGGRCIPANGVMILDGAYPEACRDLPQRNLLLNEVAGGVTALTLVTDVPVVTFADMDKTVAMLSTPVPANLPDKPVAAATEAPTEQPKKEEPQLKQTDADLNVNKPLKTQVFEEKSAKDSRPAAKYMFEEEEQRAKEKKAPEVRTMPGAEAPEVDTIPELEKFARGELKVEDTPKKQPRKGRRVSRKTTTKK